MAGLSSDEAAPQVILLDDVLRDRERHLAELMATLPYSKALEALLRMIEACGIGATFVDAAAEQA